MKTLKLFVLFVSALVVTSFSSNASAPTSDVVDIAQKESENVTITCPVCGGIDWYLDGYWVGDLFIGTHLTCITCNYVEPLE